MVVTVVQQCCELVNCCVDVGNEGIHWWHWPRYHSTLWSQSQEEQTLLLEGVGRTQHNWCLTRLFGVESLKCIHYGFNNGGLEFINEKNFSFYVRDLIWLLLQPVSNGLMNQNAPFSSFLKLKKVFLSLCVPELVFLGTVQHGIILLAYEKWASEGSGLCSASSAFLPKVKSG